MNGLPVLNSGPLSPPQAHHTWTDDEIAQYRAYWPLGTQQRLVMEFALETVSRRGEVVRLGPQHVRDGRIRIERIHGSNDVEIPMTPELQAACDAMPKTHLTYIVTAYGKRDPSTAWATTSRSGQRKLACRSAAACTDSRRAA